MAVGEIMTVLKLMGSLFLFPFPLTMTVFSLVVKVNRSCAGSLMMRMVAVDGVVYIVYIYYSAV
jgi:hypothetical protein